MHLNDGEIIKVKALGGNRMLAHPTLPTKNNNSLQLKIGQPSWKILWKNSYKPLWLIKRIQRPPSEILRYKFAC